MQRILDPGNFFQRTLSISKYTETEDKIQQDHRRKSTEDTLDSQKCHPGQEIPVLKLARV